MIARKLEQWARKQPERTALQIRNNEGGYYKISYGELYRTCLGLESKLAAAGLRAGDRISLYGENSPEWVVSYISAHFLGAVVVPLDALLGARDVLNFLNFSGVKAAVADAAHIDELTEVLRAEKSGIEAIPMEWIIKEAAGNGSIEPHAQAPDDLIAILFTSGTTGTPKGVQLTNENVLSTVKAILTKVDVSPRDNVLNILPLHHGYSSIVALISPLWAGATVTFSQSIKSTDLMSAIKETDVTIFPGVPRLFELLYNGIDTRVRHLPLLRRLLFITLFRFSEFNRKALKLRTGKLFFGKIHQPFGRRFRFFTSGGARLDPKIMNNFLTLGFRMAEGYGLTETSAVSTLTDPDNPVPGSAGKALPGVEIRIDNPDESGTGEICIKGPNVTAGYYRNDGATRELIRDGWLHSGDLGWLDPDGNLIITGRAKEVIVLPSGKNIYPEDVENAYKKSPLIKELCILPLASATGGVTGLRSVVVPEMKEIREREIFDVRDRIRSVIAMTGSSLPSYMQISDIVLSFDELPKTRLGKFKRSEIEDLTGELKKGEKLGAKALTAEQKDLVERPESVLFLTRFKEITELDGPFHPRDDLTLDLGLDSLTLVQLTALLEKDFGVLITEREISDIRTIGDILIRLPWTALRETEEDLTLKTLVEGKGAESLEDIFNLKRGFVKRTIMRAVQIIVRIVVIIAFRARIQNVDNIPAGSAALICPNHQSFIDPILIFALLPGKTLDRMLFTGFGEYFGRAPLSWIVHPLRIILTGTTRTYAESLRLATEGLRRGMSVCIFPEGARTSTGKVMNPRIGAGLLSVETDTPIVPVYIDGATETLSPLHPGLGFPTVTLTVMKPIEPVRSEEETKDLYQKTVDKWTEAMKQIEGSE